MAHRSGAVVAKTKCAMRLLVRFQPQSRYNGLQASKTMQSRVACKTGAMHHCLMTSLISWTYSTSRCVSRQLCTPGTGRRNRACPWWTCPGAACTHKPAEPLSVNATSAVDCYICHHRHRHHCRQQFTIIIIAVIRQTPRSHQHHHHHHRHQHHFRLHLGYKYDK